MTWNRSVARNLLLVVDVIAGLFLIPTSARKQRLGDRLAHTVVLVKDTAASRGEALQASPAGSFPPPAAATGAPAPAAAPAREPPPGTRRRPGGRRGSPAGSWRCS